MKVLKAGEVPALCAKYEAKIEDSKVKVSAEADLSALIDKGAKEVPGDSPIEAIVVSLLKQAVAAL